MRENAYGIVSRVSRSSLDGVTCADINPSRTRHNSICKQYTFYYFLYTNDYHAFRAVGVA